MKATLDSLNNFISESLSSCELKFKLPKELTKNNIVVTEITLIDIEYDNDEMIKCNFRARVKRCN